MGEVYLADDTKLDRKVALKVLPTEVAVNRDRMERFVREAKAAAALNHPNIAHIYEIGEADGVNFIVMEFVDGDTLREKIYHERTPLRKLLKYLAQIAEGLAKAHAASIVHRDLKPDNIMITRDGYAKILDFGLAKLIEGQRPSGFGSDASSEVATAVMPQHSLPGTVMGTIGYMSPEQAQGRVKEIDHRSDIFSFGCILFEAATGQKAFEGKDALDSLHKIVYAPTPQVKEFNTDAPEELQRIVRRCLAKDPEKRYQAIKDIAIELEELRQALIDANDFDRSGQPVANFSATLGSAHKTEASAKQSTNGTAQVSTSRASSAEYVVSEIKNHRLVFIFALLIVLLTTSGLGYWYFGNRSTNTKVIASIAVLPFENGSGDANLDYLSDGVSESVIDRLSELPQLKVIARSSSFKYRGQSADFKQVANALGVETIVTGRVVQRGDSYFIRVDLTDVRDNRQLWGENFNRKTSDVQLLQTDISREIAENLRLRLTGAQTKQLARQGTTNPQAYELVLKGRFVGYKGVTEGRKKAHEYFQQAVDLDPNYALAYAELSGSYLQLNNNGLLSQEEATRKAREAAQKALSLDESLAEAHLAMAYLKRYVWDWATAELEYKRAIELNPNLSQAHSGYSLYLSLIGQHEQAIAEIKRARDVDPLSLSVNQNVGFRLFLARQYDQAIEVLKKTLELDQNYPNAHITLGYTYAAKGMYPEAIAEYQKAISLGDESLSTQIYLAAAYTRAGEREKAQAILKRLQMNESNVSPAELGIIYVALGEREEAFASLEKAYTGHDNQLQFLGVDPNYDSLRSDPRFQDLLRRVGLPK